MWGLAEVIVEVAGDALVQVHALVSTHVVPLARIDIEVGLGASGNTGLEERISMLRHYRGIVEADNNLQPAFQVFCLRDKASERITLGVGLSI